MHYLAQPFRYLVISPEKLHAACVEWFGTSRRPPSQKTFMDQILQFDGVELVRTDRCENIKIKPSKLSLRKRFVFHHMLHLSPTNVNEFIVASFASFTRSQSREEICSTFSSFVSSYWDENSPLSMYNAKQIVDSRLPPDNRFTLNPKLLELFVFDLVYSFMQWERLPKGDSLVHQDGYGGEWVWLDEIVARNDRIRYVDNPLDIVNSWNAHDRDFASSHSKIFKFRKDEWDYETWRWRISTNPSFARMDNFPKDIVLVSKWFAFLLLCEDDVSIILRFEDGFPVITHKSSSEIRYRLECDDGKTHDRVLRIPEKYQALLSPSFGRKEDGNEETEERSAKRLRLDPQESSIMLKQ